MLTAAGIVVMIVASSPLVLLHRAKLADFYERPQETYEREVRDTYIWQGSQLLLMAALIMIGVSVTPAVPWALLPLALCFALGVYQLLRQRALRAYWLGRIAEPVEPMPAPDWVREVDEPPALWRRSVGH